MGKAKADGLGSNFSLSSFLLSPRMTSESIANGCMVQICNLKEEAGDATDPVICKPIGFLYFA